LQVEAILSGRITDLQKKFEESSEGQRILPENFTLGEVERKRQ